MTYKYKCSDLGITSSTDYFNYIEGIDTSKENLKNLLEESKRSDEFKLDSKNKLVSSENGATKSYFIYKDELLRQQKVYDKYRKVDKHIINYTYDDHGNWIQKTAIDFGELAEYMVRKVTYKKP